MDTHYKNTKYHEKDGRCMEHTTRSITSQINVRKSRDFELSGEE
jgi:hypothetical protein